MSKNNNGRGRPTSWTDEELKQLALETKYKYPGKKLTPSFLERKTSVGRNTWSRRMKQVIDELNNPILTHVPTADLTEALLPSIDLIFKKYGNNKVALKNELLELEVLLYELHKELKEYKKNEKQYNKSISKMKDLEDEVIKQRQRASHYEQLYNNIVASSMYPHLQNEEKSQVHQLNIKDKLININESKEKNIDLSNLSDHFPALNDTTEIDNNKEKEKKKKQNMDILLDDFDV